MNTISFVVVTVTALAMAGCGSSDAGAGSAPDRAEDRTQDNSGGPAGGDGSGEEGAGGGSNVAEDGETNCSVTHFTSGGESRFRVQGPPNGDDLAYDCIKCPGPEDVIKLTYTGTGFLQSLEFDGSKTNGSGASSDELILEQVGNVCWSEDYDAGADLPSASAFTVDGHAATIEFDKGPDAGGPTGTLSYYKNNVLQFAIPVTEGGELLPYPDDGVQLN